jgi:hypothetical protein
MSFEINTPGDVLAFFEELHNEKIKFNVFANCEDYVNTETNESSFDSEVAEVLNNLMTNCVKVCIACEIPITKIVNIANEILLIQNNHLENPPDLIHKII